MERFDHAAAHLLAHDLGHEPTAVATFTTDNGIALDLADNRDVAVGAEQVREGVDDAAPHLFALAQSERGLRGLGAALDLHVDDAVDQPAPGRGRERLPLRLEIFDGALGPVADRVAGHQPSAACKASSSAAIPVAAITTIAQSSGRQQGQRSGVMLPAPASAGAARFPATGFPQASSLRTTLSPERRFASCNQRRRKDA